MQQHPEINITLLAEVLPLLSFLHPLPSLAAIACLLQMLQQGCDVNCADYDQRTGLMLAAGKGHNTAVQKLVDAGAHVNMQDKLGSSALLEAVKAGHDATIE